MDVILFMNQFPSLSKSQINEGNIPRETLKIADFLRSIFLLSNSLLHENNLVIYCQNQFPKAPHGLTLFFSGKRIRYLSPDERGIVFLLYKIHKILSGVGGKKQEKREFVRFQQFEKAQSTPGIYLKRGESGDMWNLLNEDRDKFFIFGKRISDHPHIILEDVEKKINHNSVLVFFSEDEMDFKPPLKSLFYYCDDMSWKAKFYQSELISYIQAKLLSEDPKQ